MSLRFAVFSLGFVASVQAGVQLPPIVPGTPTSSSTSTSTTSTSAATIAPTPGGISPAYSKIFQKPLPIPPVATPKFTKTVNGIPVQFYESTIEPAQVQVYDTLGPANLVAYSMS